MKVLIGFLLVAQFGFPQTRGAAAAKPEAATGRIEGQVVADLNGVGLRRARVILRPLETGKPALGVETDDRGRFEIRDIPVGNYSLTAQRDGYLTSSTFRRGSLRMPPRFYLSRGERVTNVGFRLRPWSVLSGKVRFEDGDPAVNKRVDLYQQYHSRGRHGFKNAGSATTNDRGEYRIHGLAPGAYYIAVAFEGNVTGPGVQDQARVDDSGRETRVPSYTTTFYPGTARLSDALPVRLSSGEELSGMDVYMRPVERVKIGGRITDGESGQAVRAASVFLERLDSGNTGTLPVFAEVEFDAESRFHVANVAPGWYQLWIESTVENRRVQGRQTLLLTNANVEDLDVVVLPARAWKGEVVAAANERLPAGFQPHVVLEPRSERGSIVDAAPAGGPFDVLLAPGETYDMFVVNLPEDYYVAEVRASGGDVRAAGLTGSMAGSQPFQIVLESQGGKIDGQVFGPEGNVWGGATVTLIPEPATDRVQDYREAYANEYGRFRIGGIPPGRYILTAWLDEAYCDVYDASGLDACRQTGTLVDVARASTQALALNVKAQPRR